MYTVLIITLLTILLGLYRKIKKDRSMEFVKDADDTWISRILEYGFVGLVIGVAITMILTLAIMKNRDPEVYHRYLMIENLQDNNQTRGSFVLGSGTIDGVWKYTFYYRTPSGNIRLGQVEASSVDIRYTDTPPAVEYTFKKTMRVGYERIFLFGCSEEEQLVRTTILVKRGTIKQNYNLDAQ